MNSTANTVVIFVSTVAPPLAAALGFGLTTYLVYNGIGAALYCAGGLILGFLFHSQIDWLLERLSELGGRALLVVAVLLALYIVYRWWDRWRFLKTLGTARISVAELDRMISQGEDPIVLDVRSRTHRELDGRKIPGAQPVDLDDLESTLARIPGDREVVVYCACPNEVSAAKLALLLRERGILKGESKYYISLAHTPEDISFTINAWKSAINALKAG